MRRRTFLHTATAATLAPVASLIAKAPAAPRIIDTHTHFYDPTRPQGVPWPEKGTPLHRRVFPDDWAQLALPLGVTHALVVEASEWVEDNQWILDLAAKDPRIAGVVGNLDPMSPDFAPHLKRFAANPLFRGIRNRRPNAELTGLVEAAAFRASMTRLAAAGLSLDVNVGGATDLAAVAALAAHVPELRIVIDHVGGAGDPRRLSPEWKSGMRRAGAPANVFCKVSGLVEQTDSDPGRAPRELEFYLPILDHVWDCFGQDRLLYGSNWPVSDKGAPYEVVFLLAQEYVGAKGAAVSAKFYWENAQAAYRLRDR